MTDTNPPTLAERYSTATEAHTLKISDTRTGPVDVLIAAGWSGTGIGASLIRLRAEFDTVRSEVRGTGNSTLTERALILIQLRTLREVRDKLGDLALKQAAVTGFRGLAQDVMHVTGRCLDAFLDPLCLPCEGRGFNGGGRHEQSGQPILCRPCCGTGRRYQAIGRSGAEREFARHMLALMEKSASRAESRMAGRLR